MGYYTSCSMTVFAWKGPGSVPQPSTKEQEDAVFNALEELDYYPGRNGEFSEPCKWYSHSDLMKSLSEKFPDFLIVLEGHGEEYPDYWRTFSYRGMQQKAASTITFEPFDPNLF